MILKYSTNVMELYRIKIKAFQKIHGFIPIKFFLDYIN